MKKITTILTIYNESEDVILNSINSLNNQTDKNFELIIVFNGADSKTISFVNKNIKVKASIIYLKKNIGYCLARQKAIDNAKTKYIAFIDSDDLIDNSYIENFNKIEHTEDVLFLNFCFFDGQNKEEAYKFKKPPKKFKVSTLFKYSAGWTKIYNLSFLKENEISYKKTNNKYIEDYFFHIQVIYKMKTFKFLKDVKYLYFQRNNSSLNLISKKISITEIIFINLQEFIDDKKINIITNIGFFKKIFIINSIGVDRIKIFFKKYKIPKIREISILLNYVINKIIKR